MKTQPNGERSDQLENTAKQNCQQNTERQSTKGGKGASKVREMRNLGAIAEKALSYIPQADF